MNKETGGPAFPDPQENWRGEKGMTLRDHFAGLAMQAIVSNSAEVNPAFDAVAEDAYMQADAMLKARKQ